MVFSWEPLWSNLCICGWCLMCWAWLIFFAVWSGRCVCHRVCEHRPWVLLSPLSSPLQRHPAVRPWTAGSPQNKAGMCFPLWTSFFLCTDSFLGFKLQSLLYSQTFAFALGLWTVQPLQGQHTHLPQVCWVCVPGPCVWGFVQVCVCCGVCWWRLPVRWRLWSGRLAQQQITLQKECNLSLSKGKRKKKN